MDPGHTPGAQEGAGLQPDEVQGQEGHATGPVSPPASTEGAVTVVRGALCCLLVVCSLRTSPVAPVLQAAVAPPWAAALTRAC